MKAVAVTEALIYVGIIVASATLLVTQVPDMISDIKTIMSKENVIEQSRIVANLLSISPSTPNEIKITHNFPAERNYSIIIKNGLVTVTSGTDSSPPVETTAIIPEFKKTDAMSITIIKKTINGRVDIAVE